MVEIQRLLLAKLDSPACSGLDTPNSQTSSTSFSMEDDPEDGMLEDDRSADSEDEVNLENHTQVLRIRHSRYRMSTPTIVFDYPAALGIERKDHLSSDAFGQHELEEEITRCSQESYSLAFDKMHFKTDWERNCVKNAFKNAGFVRYAKDMKGSGKRWSAGWIKHLSKPQYASLHSYQKINHFPDSWVIGRKDRLMRLIQNAQRQHKLAYDFVPEGYSLPDQMSAFKRAVDRSSSALWIMKPPASACGRGIKVLDSKSLHKIPKEKKRIIQKYIARPYLVDGRKFDIRLYVLVTSMDPLRVYIFEQGLVRFCNDKYSTKASDLKNRYSHLTNYSINCKRQDYEQNIDPDKDNVGNKWSYSAFLSYLENATGDTSISDTVRKRIETIVVKTLIAAEGHITPLMHQFVPTRFNCYELYGFDFMLDEKLRPWLIEVNISPSLMGSSPLDRRIKGTLMADIFHLVGFRFPNTTNKPVLQSSNSTSSIRSVLSTSRKSTKAKPSKCDWKVDPKQKSMKNLKSTNALTYADIPSLTKMDWDIIYDLEEELDRVGHFNCIYPTSNSNQYTKYFSAPRYFNTICTRWLQCKRQNNLHFQPQSTQQHFQNWTATTLPNL